MEERNNRLLNAKLNKYIVPGIMMSLALQPIRKPHQKHQPSLKHLMSIVFPALQQNNQYLKKVSRNRFLETFFALFWSLQSDPLGKRSQIKLLIVFKFSGSQFIPAINSLSQHKHAQLLVLRRFPVIAVNCWCAPTKVNGPFQRIVVDNGSSKFVMVKLR